MPRYVRNIAENQNVHIEGNVMVAITRPKHHQQRGLTTIHWIGWSFCWLLSRLNSIKLPSALLHFRVFMFILFNRSGLVDFTIKIFDYSDCKNWKCTEWAQKRIEDVTKCGTLLSTFNVERFDIPDFIIAHFSLNRHQDPQHQPFKRNTSTFFEVCWISLVCIDAWKCLVHSLNLWNVHQCFVGGTVVSTLTATLYSITRHRTTFDFYMKCSLIDYSHYSFWNINKYYY